MLQTEKRNFKRILFYFFYPLIFFMRVIPRNKNIWIFGNFKGYIDNTKYLYEYLIGDENNTIEVYWITKDKMLYDNLKANNKSVLYHYSILGMWKSIRAGVSFFSNGYSDLNRIASIDSLTVNLWHGFPIKKLAFDTQIEVVFYSFGKLNKLLTFLSEKSLQLLHDKIDLHSVSSIYDLERMSNAFKVNKEKFIITGTPRFDIIKNKTISNSVISNIFFEHNITDGKNILYAPTWREKGWSFNQKLINPNKLQNYLEKSNSYFFIKRHPLTTEEEILNWGIKESGRIRFIESFDINESYQFVDVLITDFSSLIFDYGILNKPILYFITDLQEYASNRGFYDDIFEISNNNINENWNQLIDSLEHIQNNNNYINHKHFDYIINNPINNVRKNIIEIVKKELLNG